jgi:hypothetical protein
MRNRLKHAAYVMQLRPSSVLAPTRPTETVESGVYARFASKSRRQMRLRGTKNAISSGISFGGIIT